MVLERIIRKLKNKPDYKWESKYSTRDLIVVSVIRGLQIIRGLFYKLILGESAGLLFVGKNVTIRHGYKIRAGKNLIIEDNVHINALSTNGITIGDDVSIARDCNFICTGVVAQQGEGITIGSGSGITSGVFLGGQGGIKIGQNVIIGPGTKIFSENHNFSDPKVTIKDQGVSRKGIVIEDNCWLGGGVIVLDGVTIGEGSVIAAGSVITKSIPANSVAAGVPAKVIKNRISD
jgi:acetyltransferase-like isoleucine patch superfamily enzyme